MRVVYVFSCASRAMASMVRLPGAHALLALGACSWNMVLTADLEGFVVVGANVVLCVVFSVVFVMVVAAVIVVVVAAVVRTFPQEPFWLQLKRDGGTAGRAGMPVAELRQKRPRKSSSSHAEECDMAASPPPAPSAYIVSW